MSTPVTESVPEPVPEPSPVPLDLHSAMMRAASALARASEAIGRLEDPSSSPGDNQVRSARSVFSPALLPPLPPPPSERPPNMPDERQMARINASLARGVATMLLRLRTELDNVIVGFTAETTNDAPVDADVVDGLRAARAELSDSLQALGHVDEEM